MTPSKRTKRTSEELVIDITGSGLALVIVIELLGLLYVCGFCGR